MADTEPETESVVVVGMNRTRLLKIMEMVHEEDISDGENGGDHAVMYIPCVAAMSSYEGQDGEDVRYMASFVFHDGSPMNQFFDDEEFRASLKKVIMVGYEWKEADQSLVQKYFEAFLLPDVTVECVVPNPEFSSLSEELHHYKNLTAEEKEEHSLNHTMGPKKMKRFILDTLRSSTKSSCPNEAAVGATEPENDNDDDADCLDDAENDVGATEAAPTVSEEKEEEELLDEERTPNFDPNATTFACRMCRTVLLDENHLDENQLQNQHAFKKRPNHPHAGAGSRGQSLFCDESVLEWLAPRGTEYDLEGKLVCPKCSFKVGHWNWSGVQISGGIWVVPAFQIPLGKIDVILPLSERHTETPMVVVTPKAF